MVSEIRQLNQNHKLISTLLCLATLPLCSYGERDALPADTVTQYLLEESKVRTVQNEFTEKIYQPHTIPPAGNDDGGNEQKSDKRTNSSGGHDEHAVIEDCLLDKLRCNGLVRRCAGQIFKGLRLRDDGEEDDYVDENETDECTCVFHCFQHFGTACSKLERQINRRMRRWDSEPHSVFNHLSEMMGSFSVGCVVGFAITLLIVNLVKKCVTQQQDRPNRDIRLGSLGTLSHRAPMPSPIPAPEGLYSESPVSTLNPKFVEHHLKGVGQYEEVKDPPRPPLIRSESNHYFVLEDERRGGSSQEQETAEDGDIRPSGSTQRSSGNPDVVPVSNDIQLGQNMSASSCEIEDSKL